MVYDAPIAHGVASLLPQPFNTLAESVVIPADLSGARQFGPNPATNPNFIPLETGATLTPDGRMLGGASGHSDYPRWDSAPQSALHDGPQLAAVIVGTTPIPQK
jgi:hypothetical protein